MGFEDSAIRLSHLIALVRVVSSVIRHHNFCNDHSLPCVQLGVCQVAASSRNNNSNDASSLQWYCHSSGTGGSDEHYGSRRMQMEGMGYAEGTGSALTEQTGKYQTNLCRAKTALLSMSAECKGTSIE